MDVTYLDHAATTPLSDAVRRAIAPYLEDEFGNPSSRHLLGARVADALETARAEVARALGAHPSGVVFTSGGTEANNLAVLGLARGAGRRGRHVLVGATEHPSVAAPAAALAAEGYEVETLRLDSRGDLDLDDLAKRVRPDTALVSVMFVNNLFGTIQPVEDVAEIVAGRAPEARVHVDAIQAAGKLDVSLGELGVHALSVSAHKIHGPKGAGALVLARGVEPRPLVFGGGQQGGVRPGTENVIGAVGLAAAVTEAVGARRETWSRLTELRRRFVEGLEPLGACPVAPGTRLSPSIVAAELPGPPAEVWLHHLEAEGVLTSVGSACQSRGSEIPPALLALGFTEERARQVLRVSFSSASTEADVERGLEVLARVAASLSGDRVEA